MKDASKVSFEEMCCICEEIKEVYVRDIKYRAICAECYSKMRTGKVEECCKCGKKRKVFTFKNGMRLCLDCY